MKPRRRRLRDVRTRLLLIPLGALALALAAATFGFNVLLANQAQSNIDALLRQRVDSERALLTIQDRRITVAETQADSFADSLIWIFEGRRAVEAPAARSATRNAVTRLVGGPRRFADVSATDQRLLAAPVANGHGTRIGTIVAGVSTAPYEQTLRTTVIGSLLLAAVLLGLVGAAAWWLLRSALKPVAQMTEQAAAWSVHDLDRRFELGEPHDELTRLAATLDELLDRIAASLRHERRFSAEVSHELRTPLAKMIAEAELALRRPRSVGQYRAALATTTRHAQQIARIVETLVAVAQRDAGVMRGTADAYTAASDALAALQHVAAERGVVAVADPPSRPIRVGVDKDFLERVLQPVIDNACRYARSNVRIEIDQQGNKVNFAVADDGAGIEPDEVPSIFEPGVRGRAARGTAGAGLGLALARRLAVAASGEIAYRRDVDGSAFVVSLPAG